MRVDVKPDWEVAKAISCGPDSSYLSVVKPAVNPEVELLGLVQVYKEIPYQLDIPVGSVGLRSGHQSDCVLMEDWNKDNLSLARKVKSVVALRNWTVLQGYPGVERAPMFVGDPNGKRVGAYILSSHAIFGEDLSLQMRTYYISGGNLREQGIDGYAGRVERKLGLFTLEPFDLRHF